jgi:hypothetical protein
MPRKVVLVAAVVAICLSVSAQARAQTGDAGSSGAPVTTAPPTTVASVSKTGEGLVLDVGAGTPDGSESSKTGAAHPGSDPGSDPSAAAGSPPPVVCVWVNYDIKDPRVIASSAVKVVDHVTSSLQESVCGGVPTGTLRWFEILTDESVIWATYAKAKATVKPQMPLLAPPGLQYKSWPTDIYFKPEQLTVPAATATLPSGFVISVQPVARVVTFHPGSSDGEPLVCPMLPVAFEQCRYTYRETSKGAPDLKFLASVSIEWDFVFSSSGPGSVVFPHETLVQPMRIPVAKIQTVGA